MYLNYLHIWYLSFFHKKMPIPKGFTCYLTLVGVLFYLFIAELIGKRYTYT